MHTLSHILTAFSHLEGCLHKSHIVNMCVYVCTYVCVCVCMCTYIDSDTFYYAVWYIGPSFPSRMRVTRRSPSLDYKQKQHMMMTLVKTSRCAVLLLPLYIARHTYSICHFVCLTPSFFVCSSLSLSLSMTYSHRSRGSVWLVTVVDPLVDRSGILRSPGKDVWVAGLADSVMRLGDVQVRQMMWMTHVHEGGMWLPLWLD